MDLSRTHRLSLPLLHAGQAQKEIWHNEALALLDLMVQPVVRTIGDTMPPAAPQPGDCHIVGAGAGAGWAGQDHAVAGWTAGGWRFFEPFEGMRLLLAEPMVPLTFDGGAWRVGSFQVSELVVEGVKVVGPRGAPIALPMGGTTTDIEARGAISAILSALTAHGLIGPSAP